MIDKLETYGEWTYRMAWLLEITAALIGFSVAAVMIINGLEADTNKSGYLSPIVNAIGPAGAFVMVALAELTKIPLATLLFAADRIFKPVVIVILFGMAFITYETVFFGLERAQTIREAAYTEVIERISIIEAKLNSNVSADSFQSIDEAKANNANSIENQKKQLSALEKTAKMKVEQMRLDGISEKDKTKLSSIERSLEEIDRQLAELDSSWEKWSSERQKIYDDFVAQIGREFDKIVEAGDTDKALKYRKEKLGPVATPKNRADWKKREAEYNRSSNSLRDQKKQLFVEKESILSSATVTEANNRKIQSYLDDVETRRQKILDRIDALNDKALEYSDKSFEFSENKIREAEEKIEATFELKKLQAERIKQARLDQVRRFASKWFGIAPEEVNNEQAGKFALIWFGSLSILAALAGPVTAVTALSLQHIANVKRLRLENSEDAPKFTAGERFYRSLRHLIVHWRFERKKTVIKEVPVQQVVKEFVYIPLLADEPEEVHELLERDLPEEVRAEIKGRVVDTLSSTRSRVTSGKAAKNKTKRKTKTKAKGKTKTKTKRKTKAKAKAKAKD